MKFLRLRCFIRCRDENLKGTVYPVSFIQGIPGYRWERASFQVFFLCKKQREKKPRQLLFSFRNTMIERLSQTFTLIITYKDKDRTYQLNFPGSKTIQEVKPLVCSSFMKGAFRCRHSVFLVVVGGHLKYLRICWNNFCVWLTEIQWYWSDRLRMEKCAKLWLTIAVQSRVRKLFFQSQVPFAGERRRIFADRRASQTSKVERVARRHKGWLRKILNLFSFWFLNFTQCKLQDAFQ